MSIVVEWLWLLLLIRIILYDVLRVLSVGYSCVNSVVRLFFLLYMGMMIEILGWLVFRCVVFGCLVCVLR